MKNITIGLFGFGVVGEGIYKVLEERPSLNATIKKVCIKDPNKKRDAPNDLFTTEQKDILLDESINVVVELIDDADAAYIIVKQALESGKHVVSANKKMIAENLPELIDLQHANNTTLLHEAAVCGSIPIIRNLEEYFDNDLLSSVSGIVNGSTNFILTQMGTKGAPYDETLKIAQELGFAESNPYLDVEGIDAVNKLSIVTYHAFGQKVTPENIIRWGITSLTPEDFTYAKEKGNVIKLVAKTYIDDNQKLHASVLPTFVGKTSKLGLIDNEYNGVVIASTLSDEQFLSGKGAGRYPTSSAVLSDISALRYDYKYEFKKANKNVFELDHNKVGKFFVSFPADVVFDYDLLEEIEVKHFAKNRNYVIGDIAFKNIEKLKKIEGTSLIAFEQD